VTSSCSREHLYIHALNYCNRYPMLRSLKSTNINAVNLAREGAPRTVTALNHGSFSRHFHAGHGSSIYRRQSLEYRSALSGVARVRHYAQGPGGGPGGGFSMNFPGMGTPEKGEALKQYVRHFLPFASVSFS
jgi:hypothetical protein